MDMDKVEQLLNIATLSAASPNLSSITALATMQLEETAKTANAELAQRRADKMKADAAAQAQADAKAKATADAAAKPAFVPRPSPTFVPVPTPASDPKSGLTSGDR